jgi:hypothetical protein
MFNWLFKLFGYGPDRVPDRHEKNDSKGKAVEAIIVIYDTEDLQNAAEFLTHVLESRPSQVAFTIVGKQEDNDRLQRISGYLLAMVTAMGHVCYGKLEFAEERPKTEAEAISIGHPDGMAMVFLGEPSKGAEQVPSVQGTVNDL